MKILKQQDLKNIIFIDIETVNLVPELLPNTPLYDSWAYKVHNSPELSELPLQESFKEKAALYAEFAKIVCISIGKIENDTIKIASFSEHDEAKLLQKFTDVITKLVAANKNIVLCGHAIKGFDIPFVMKRCIINQIPLPLLFDNGHLKPWEVSAIDTMELWKGGGFNSASLLNISTALGLPNPKMDIAGYQTNTTYYGDVENGLRRITEYCERDVLTVANIVRKFRFEAIVTQSAAKEKEPVVQLLTGIYNSGKVTPAQNKMLEATYNKLPDAQKAKATELINIALKTI